MPPAPRVYRDDPELTVLRVVQGVTLYLAEPMEWARGLAQQVFQSFVAYAPEGTLRWFASSVIDGWQPLSQGDLARVGAELDLPWHLARLRHPVRIRVGDAPGAGSWRFHYRELDPERGGSAGWLQLHTPFDAPTDDLLARCLELANTGPFTHGVAGYHAAWNLRDRATSFADALAWCRRYAGLHLDDPDAACVHAAKHLTATDWITLVGDRLLAAQPDLAAALDHAEWTGAVRMLRARHGRLVIAGERPSLGDRNTLTLPNEYAEVATALSPWLAPTMAPFAKWPTKPDESAAWRLRLVEPAAWEQAITDE